MLPADLIVQYLAGPQLIRQAVFGMTDEQLDAAPIAGKWSTRQVVCHIADFEPVYADRMKRISRRSLVAILTSSPQGWLTINETSKKNCN